MKKLLILLICMLPTVATWAETTFNYAYDGQTLKYRVTNESKKNLRSSRKSKHFRLSNYPVGSQWILSQVNRQ